jgi:hypothetical protein
LTLVFTPSAAFDFQPPLAFSQVPICFSLAVLHTKCVEDSFCTWPTPCPAPVRLYFFDLSRVRVQQSGSVVFVSSLAPVPSFRALVFSASVSCCRRLGSVSAAPKYFSLVLVVFLCMHKVLDLLAVASLMSPRSDCAAPQPFKFLPPVWCYVLFCLQSSILSVVESLQEEVDMIFELSDQKI